MYVLHTYHTHSVYQPASVGKQFYVPGIYFDKRSLCCVLCIYPLTCRGPVSGTQNIDTVVFLFPRGELKGGYMYFSPVAPHNSP